MNRREFLKLKVRGTERILELSCERLYMRYVDAQAGVGLARVADEVEISAGDWEGEPPLAVVTSTTDQLLAELERRLSSADVLRVTGREWLSGEDFRHAVESRIRAFRERGGRVQ